MEALKVGRRLQAVAVAALVALAALTAAALSTQPVNASSPQQGSLKVSTVEVTAYLHDRVAGPGGVGTIVFRRLVFSVSPSGSTTEAVSLTSFEVGRAAKYAVRPSPYPGYVEWVINVSASSLDAGLVSNLIIYHRIKGAVGPVTVRLLSPSGRVVMEFTAVRYEDVAVGPSTYALNVSWHDFIPPLIITHDPQAEASSLTTLFKQVLGTPAIPACMTLQVITRSEGILQAPTLKWVEYCVPTRPLSEYGVALPEPMIVSSAELAIPAHVNVSKSVLQVWEMGQPYYAIAAYAAPTASGLGQPVNEYSAATPEYWLGPKPLLHIVNWTAVAVRTAAGYLRVERPATLYVYVIEGAEGVVTESLIIISAIPYPEYVSLSTIISNRTALPASILAKLKALENRVAALEAEVTGLETISRNVSSSVNEVLKGLKSLSTELTPLKAGLGKLVEEVSSLKARLGRVSSLVSTLRSNVTSLKALISGVEGRVNEVYARLNAYVSGNASLLNTKISELSKGLASVKSLANQALGKAIKASSTASEALTKAEEALSKASNALTTASKAYATASELASRAVSSPATPRTSPATTAVARAPPAALWVGVAGVVLGCVAIGLALASRRRVSG